MTATPHTDTAPSSASSLAYRRDIDGLRGLAVLLVLVFHFQLLPVGKAGFIGVDVFFVISGFLITSIVRRQLDSGSFGLPAFYLARLRRLAPGLVVILLASALWGYFRLLPSEFEELGRQVLAAQFYVSNIYYWRNYNYFGLGSGNVFLLHAWSLAVEEQFYLVYPLLLVALHRWFRSAFWWCLAALTAASFALNIAWVVPKAMNTFYLLPTRSWELLAGALLAGLPLRTVSTGLREVIGALAWALLVTAVLSYHPGIPVPGWFALLPVGAALGLLIAGGDARTVSSRLLSTGVPHYIGKVSYALYLVHWPLHVYARRELGDGYTYGWRALMFAASFVAAHLVWRWVESPVRERRFVPHTRSLLAAYAAVLLSTLAVAGFVVQSNGWPSRLPAQAVKLDAYRGDRSPPLKECAYTEGWSLPPPQTCRMGDPDKAPTWIVMGDSHAWAGHAVFSTWLRARGESGWLVYRHACPPLLGIHLAGDLTDECGRFNRTVYDWIARSPEIANLMLVSTWVQAPEAALTTAPGVRSDRATSLALFSETFDSSLRELRRLEKKVWVWGPVPGARVDVPSTLALATWHGNLATATEIEYTAAEHAKHFGFFAAAVERAGPLIERYIDTASVLCASGRCQATHDGVPLYFDNAHMAASAAPEWSRVMNQGSK